MVGRSEQPSAAQKFEWAIYQGDVDTFAIFHGVGDGEVKFDLALGEGDGQCLAVAAFAVDLHMVAQWQITWVAGCIVDQVIHLLGRVVQAGAGVDVGHM